MIWDIPIKDELFKEKPMSLLKSLEKLGLNYCLLKGWERFCSPSEDIDLIVSMPRLEEYRKLSEYWHVERTRKIPYTTHVMVHLKDNRLLNFHIHFGSLRIHDIRFLPEEEVWKRRLNLKGLWFPKLSLYGASLLLNWLFSKGFSNRDQKISEKKKKQMFKAWQLLRESSSEIQDALLLLDLTLKREYSLALVELIIEEKWDQFEKEANDIKRKIAGGKSLLYLVKEKLYKIKAALVK